jgi:hypothetical protein
MNQFPRGKLTDDDEGQIALVVGERDGTIIIDFGKSVVWVGMSKPEAIAFAIAILHRVGVSLEDKGRKSDAGKP